MSAAIDDLKLAWRDYVTDGVPATGENEPVKSEIRAAFDKLETELSSIGAGILRYETKALLDANVTATDGQLAYVWGDATAANNTVYQSDAGVWAEATWYFNAVAAVVQPLVDEAEGFRDEAQAAVAALESSFARWAGKLTTRTADQRIKADGTAEAATFYDYYTVSVDGLDVGFRLTAKVTGTTFPVASYYSDPAGDPASYLSSSAELGGSPSTLYTQLVLTPPASTRCVKFNAAGPSSGQYAVPIFETLRILDDAAAEIDDIKTRLLETTSLAPITDYTATSNERLAIDGTLVAASGYANYLVPLSTDVTRVIFDTYVTGTSNPAIFWYSDALGTVPILPGVERGGITLHITGDLPKVAGALSCRIAGVVGQAFSASLTRLTDLLPDRVQILEDVTADVPEIKANLYGWVNQAAVATYLDQHIDPSTGDITAGTSYVAAVYAYDAGKDARAGGQVIGSGRYLATYYSGFSGGLPTGYIGQEYHAGSQPEWTGVYWPAYQEPLTVPEGTAYIGINGAVGDYPRLELFEIAITAGNAASTWAGTIGASFGDSITAQYFWQPDVIAALGLARLANNGIGGSTVSKPDNGPASMCDSTRIDAIAADSGLILFMGGVNDHGQNRPLGALSAVGTTSFMDTTFYGALEEVATKLLARFSASQRIVWMTPTFADRSGAIPASWADAFTNTLGLTIHDYADAVRATARKYGFPLIDVLASAGWNSVNASVYMTNESGSYIHPNATVGGPRIAEIVIGALRAIEPV